jgi:hypothetical protein
MPKPRLFYGADHFAASDTVPRPAGRRRAARSGPSELALHMQMRGDCIDETPAQWRFTRDGVFGVAKRGETTIEAVFDAPHIYFRLSAPFAKEPVQGTLTEENGFYSGTAEVLTECGKTMMSVSAKLE